METSQEKTCFVLCVSWGVGLSAQGNNLKRLFMLSNLSVFVTRHFSFSPLNNGDRNFVTLNNNSFVPMGAKNTQVTTKQKGILENKCYTVFMEISLSHERISKTTFSLAELSSCSFILTDSAGKHQLRI